MDISIVIPVRNGAATLGQQLDSLVAQHTSCSWELVVADNGSTDGTADLVRAHPICAIVPTRVIDAGTRPSFNIPRNTGVAAARGRIVLLLDCDDETEPEWVESYWRALRDAPPSIAAGPLTIEELNAPHIRGWGLGLPNPPPSQARFPSGWGANMGFHRAVWELVDGFDESYKRGFNEIEFFAAAHAAGVPFVWVAAPPVHYRLHPSRRRNLVKAFEHGKGAVHFARHHRDGGMRMPRAGTTVITAIKMLVRVPFTALRDRDGAKGLLRAVFYQLGMLVGLARRRDLREALPRRSITPTVPPP